MLWGSGRFLWAAIAVVAFCLAGSPSEARASCVASVDWRGVSYVGVSPSNERFVKSGPKVGRGIEPGCDDVVGGPPPKDFPVTIRRVAGVPPALAIYAAGSLHLAPGFLPALPGHPLHRAFYGSRPGVPNATRGARCRRLDRLRGVVGSSFFDVELNPAGKRRRVEVRVDALTGIAGFQRAGHPYLSRGDALTVSGWSCRSPEEDGPFVVARAIRPAR